MIIIIIRMYSKEFIIDSYGDRRCHEHTVVYCLIQSDCIIQIIFHSFHLWKQAKNQHTLGVNSVL